MKERKNTGKSELAVFIVLFIISLIILVRCYVPVILESARARSWKETPCIVESCGVTGESHMTKNGQSTSHWVDIKCAYEYNRMKYHCTRYSFFSTMPYDKAAEIVSHYPAGTKTVCYVDPNAPWQSVVNREDPVKQSFIFLGMLAAAGGGAFILAKVSTLFDRAKKTGVWHN